MKRIMVSYKVKADRVAKNDTLIRPDFDQLKHKAPVGLRYATFRIPDAQSFAHVVSVETADGINPLSQMAAKRHTVWGRSGPGTGP